MNAISRHTARGGPLRGLLGHPGFVVGAVVLLFWLACAIGGTALAPQDPYAVAPRAALLPPSADHWFGTDRLGRDVFSRVLAGARDILAVAPLATLLGTAVGTVLGLFAGYYRGAVDAILGRLIEVVLALPLVIVALFALSALGGDRLTVVVVIAAVFAPITARTVRAATGRERNLDYVAAAQLRGEHAGYIVFREILPNIAATVVVEAAVRLGYAIFTVATLSFLGFGTQPPSPDWGLTIAENYTSLAGGAWWTVAFAALATASLVIAVNLIADALGQDLR
ncbi:ABC transporter permease [Chitinasiproducens palmae]|uniref:Peptide/nickel transport system permease protein n=1 Tax=Chitinasiproducens palmae TaxID=1770053 RepID=A0A1H2PRD7_9BURK|nr:ABC transporter permease [Chitinasiproducens palmae]SDV49392.1 peptide/nickel transport system permease protein [Chitinasiproducens palmae]